MSVQDPAWEKREHFPASSYPLPTQKWTEFSAFTIKLAALGRGQNRPQKWKLNDDVNRVREFEFRALTFHCTDSFISLLFWIFFRRGIGGNNNRGIEGADHGDGVCKRGRDWCSDRSHHCRSAAWTQVRWRVTIEGKLHIYGANILNIVADSDFRKRDRLIYTLHLRPSSPHHINWNLDVAIQGPLLINVKLSWLLIIVPQWRPETHYCHHYLQNPICIQETCCDCILDQARKIIQLEMRFILHFFVGTGCPPE